MLAPWCNKVRDLLTSTGFAKLQQPLLLLPALRFLRRPDNLTNLTCCLASSCGFALLDSESLHLGAW